MLKSKVIDSEVIAACKDYYKEATGEEFVPELLDSNVVFSTLMLQDESKKDDVKKTITYLTRSAEFDALLKKKELMECASSIMLENGKLHNSINYVKFPVMDIVTYVLTIDALENEIASLKKDVTPFWDSITETDKNYIRALAHANHRNIVVESKGIVSKDEYASLQKMVVKYYQNDNGQYKPIKEKVQNLFYRLFAQDCKLFFAVDVNKASISLENIKKFCATFVRGARKDDEGNYNYSFQNGKRAERLFNDLLTVELCNRFITKTAQKVDEKLEQKEESATKTK